MRNLILAATAALLALPAAAAQAQTPVAAEQPLLHEVAGQIQPERMRADITSLVGFGTRHTMSDTVSDTRGIGAARRWTERQFHAMSADCGGCLEIALPADTVTGRRVPTPTEVVDVLAIQRGTGDPNRVIVISGHIDSRVTDVMDATSDAPGANDDASGVALVLETARLLSKRKFDATIVYVAFSAEEQGLWGAELLADTAAQRGWQVSAMLNNDIVGNAIGQGGVRDADRVRVFSEGIRAVEDLPQQQRRRGEGGEDDGPSRALAKTIDTIADAIPGGFDVVIDRRPDRFGRGGDHEPFLKRGYPAVRFSVGAENWDAQHQNLRTENGVVYGDTIDRMDFAYLAKVTAINAATIARLAAAPAAPASVGLVGDLSRDTQVSWSAVPGAAGYRIRWRPNDTATWAKSQDVAGTSATLRQVPVDDTFFAVSALAADGSESLPTFGGRAPRR